MADDKERDPDALLIRRSADFVTRYANNVRFEGSVWDLKTYFGTLDQGEPDPKSIPAAVDFHTAVTIPWIQAKLMLYNLHVQVMFHELKYRNIAVPENLGPQKLSGFMPDLAESPAGKELLERADKLWVEIFTK